MVPKDFFSRKKALVLQMCNYVHLRQSIYIKVAQIKNLHMEPEIREKLLRNSKNA